MKDKDINYDDINIAEDIDQDFDELDDNCDNFVNDHENSDNIELESATKLMKQKK
jgi:hypothetical protein